MELICCKKYDKIAIDGPMRINVGTKVQSKANILFHEDKRICLATSQNCYDHFAINDDGYGRKRFSLTHGILADVEKIKADYYDACREIAKEQIPTEEKQRKFDALDNKPERFFSAMYADPIFSKYLKNGTWGFMFYYAGIDQLERLDALMKEVKENA